MILGEVLSKQEINEKGNITGYHDTYSYDVGDLLLIEVAHRLKSGVRKHDVVSRIDVGRNTIKFHK